MSRDVDERELVRRLTDSDPDVLDAALAEDFGRAYRPFLLNELGLVLADDTRSGSWPHAVHWLEFIAGNSHDFADLMTMLVPPTEHVPYEESVLVNSTSEDEYRALMAELDDEWRTAARGLTAGLGLTGRDGPPVFSPETETEPGTGTGLPRPRTDPDTWRSIAGAIAALNSPLEWVRGNAVSYLAGFGSDIVDTLHAVRRSRMRARRAVVAALADIGWDELDARDRRVVERLIRIRQRTEKPGPMQPNGVWFALATADRAAVLDAFDLCDPVPVTMRMGAAAWKRVWTDGYGSGPVFVSPVLDGWTLVFDADADQRFGEWPEDDEEDGAPYFRYHNFCVELSRRFVAALWFFELDDGGCHDRSAWCVAEDGNLVAHNAHDFFDAVPTPAQLAELAAWLDTRDPGGESAQDRSGRWRFPAWRVAERLTVDLHGLDASTRVEGHGVLALPAARPDIRHRGGFPV